MSNGVMRPPSRRPLALALLALMAALAFAATAWAHHTDNMYKTATYGPNCSTETNCQSDNSTLTYFRQSSLDATSQQNVANVLNEKYNPTDLTVVHENPPVYTGGSETDLIYQVNNQLLPNARTVCDDPISDTKCDQFFLIFSNNATSASNNAIVCHETGHGVGLTHGDRASPVKPNNDQSLECLAFPAPYVLADHSVPQINATY